MPVLLVEDNELDVEITKRALVRCGLPVDLSVARDGGEALHVLSQEGTAAAVLPRVILLDLRLPMTDGWDVLRRVKHDARLCVIPVVVLTGINNERDVRQCVELGTNMFFVKPMTSADAVEILTAVSKYWSLMESLTRARA